MPFGSASASGIKLHPPPKPPKKEKEPLLPPPNPNPNPSRSPNLDPVPHSMPTGEGSSADAALSQSQFLSREEVLRRRSRRIKQLARVYRRQYWALIEEVRVKHRDYYWEFGKSPVEEEEGGNGNREPWEKNAEGERKRCGFSGCKSKAMPLTRFCHQHILADSKQTLYKPCSFVTKSAQSVHITCGKPVLRAAVPCLCPVHFQKIQKQISQALKKAGLNSSSRPTPKFHVLIAESVRQIQARRKKALNTTINADKPSDSSLGTTDQTELDIIGKDAPLPVEEKIPNSQCMLQKNDIQGMMGSNRKEAQLGCPMTTVK